MVTIAIVDILFAFLVSNIALKLGKQNSNLKY